MKEGTRFIGNVNGVEMQLVKIEGANAIIEIVKTGKTFIYGYDALSHCNLKIKIHM